MPRVQSQRLRRPEGGRQAAAAGWRDAGATHRPGTVQRRLRGPPHAGRGADTWAARSPRPRSSAFGTQSGGLSSGAREARRDTEGAGAAEGLHADELEADEAFEREAAEAEAELDAALEAELALG